MLSGWPKPTYNIRGPDNNGYGCKGMLRYESSPIIANLDDDADYEIVVGSMRNVFDDNKNPDETWHCEGRIYAFNWNGSRVPGFPVDINGELLSTPVAGDINKDGYDEIIVGTMFSKDGSGLYVIDKRGQILKGWPQLDNEDLWNFASLFDIEKDGYLEMMIDNPWGNGLFDYKGNSLYIFGRDYTNSVIGNLEKSSSFLAISSYEYPYYEISAYNFSTSFDGEINSIKVKNFPKFTGGTSMLSIADIDKNNNMELIAGIDNLFSEDHKSFIFAWDLEEKIYQAEWPMFQHDSGHTGNYNYGKEPSSEKPQSKIVNNADIEINGILLMKLQKKLTSGNWADFQVVTNQSVSIPAKSLIKLDVGGNYGWNLKNVKVPVSGNYRVYASFKVGEQIIEKTWEFRVV